MELYSVQRTIFYIFLFLIFLKIHYFSEYFSRKSEKNRNHASFAMRLVFVDRWKFSRKRLYNSIFRRRRIIIIFFFIVFEYLLVFRTKTVWWNAAIVYRRTRNRDTVVLRHSGADSRQKTEKRSKFVYKRRKKNEKTEKN